MGEVIKFPDDGRIVRFGCDAAEEPATIIILPTIRTVVFSDDAEPVVLDTSEANK